MNTIIIKADNKLTKALVAICSALNLTYEVKKDEALSSVVEEEGAVYDPEFVKMVLERAESARKGNTVPYTDEMRKELFG
jgi:response regulator RpfG family c-di-GMP phosphodiesterase